jgi:hypothetical protein
VRGSNIGFARSFFALLKAAPEDADIVMLSDQDDVWLPGKVDRAVMHLLPRRDRPSLYCSRLQLVDEALRPLGLTPSCPLPPSFRNALTENIAFGCTCALNQAGLALAKEAGDLRLLQFHDWWLYLVVSAFGEVIFDPEPTILYRQHSANTVGADQGWRRLFRGMRLMRRRNWVHAMFGQIENFRRVHSDRLSASDRRLLDRYFDPSRPAAITRLLLVPRRFRQKVSDDFLLRALLLAALLSGRGLLPTLAN